MSELQEANQEILPSRDKRYLEVASERLIQQFIQDYPEKLPDAVILPETTARPLAYLLKPIFSRLAATRGVTAPHLIFFKVIQEKADLTPVGEGRAKEIVQKLQSIGIQNPTVAIFDDYMSGEANTVREIRRSFHDPNIPAYVLLAPDKKIADAHTRFGRIDPFLVKPLFTRIPGDITESKGFYYGRDSHRMKKVSIGVDKTSGGRFVAPLREGRDPEPMRILRTEMAIIGQRIAANL